MEKQVEKRLGILIDEDSNEVWGVLNIPVGVEIPSFYDTLKTANGKACVNVINDYEVGDIIEVDGEELEVEETYEGFPEWIEKLVKHLGVEEVTTYDTFVR